MARQGIYKGFGKQININKSVNNIILKKFKVKVSGNYYYYIKRLFNKCYNISAFIKVVKLLITLNNKVYFNLKKITSFIKFISKNLYIIKNLVTFSYKGYNFNLKPYFTVAFKVSLYNLLKMLFKLVILKVTENVKCLLKITLVKVANIR